VLHCTHIVPLSGHCHLHKALEYVLSQQRSCGLQGCAMINAVAASSQAAVANQSSRVQSSLGRRSCPVNTLNSRAIVPQQIERRVTSRAAPCGKVTRPRLSSGCTPLAATGSGGGGGITPPATPITGGDDDEQPDEGAGAAEDIDGIMAAVRPCTCLTAMASRSDICCSPHTAKPKMSCTRSKFPLHAGRRQLCRAASRHEGETCSHMCHTCMQAKLNPVLHAQRRSVSTTECAGEGHVDSRAPSAVAAPGPHAGSRATGEGRARPQVRVWSSPMCSKLA
jgi:hypothetical protein